LLFFSPLVGDSKPCLSKEHLLIFFRFTKIKGRESTESKPWTGQQEELGWGSSGSGVF